MQAVEVITDAYERLNRLSPGEPLSADDAAFGFRRLNLLVDELSAQNAFLYRDVIVSAVQAGNITLGAGSWASIAPGAEIISASVDGLVMAPITMEQYNSILIQGTIGMPMVYAHDGMATVFLWPVASNQTIRLQTRIGVAAFADQTTDYGAPPGWKNALGAMLAVRLAPTLLGGVPPGLVAAERRACLGVMNYQPRITDVGSFTGVTINNAAELF